jgi:hypothetical protein
MENMESKSVYEPPTGDDVLLRKIHVSPYNQNRIGLIIGKEGHNFIKITETFNLLYVYYINEHIEIYGKNIKDIFQAITVLTNQIRILNHSKTMYYDIDHILTFQDCYEIDQKFTGKGGNFWLKAYNNPKEGDIINLSKQKCVATNVGLFTFSLEIKEEITENQEESTENKDVMEENQEESTENQEESTENQEESTENKDVMEENQEESTENQEESTENQEESTENKDVMEENQEESTENQEESTI